MLAQYAPIMIVFSVTFIAVWVLVILLLLLCETTHSISLLGQTLGPGRSGTSTHDSRLAVSRDMARVHEALDEMSPLEVVGCAAGGAGSGCAVCLDALVAGQIGRALKCGHRFHARCIDRWVLQCAGGGGTWTGIGCPLCKTSVVGSGKRQAEKRRVGASVVASDASGYEVGL